MTKALLKIYQKFDCYYLYVSHTFKGKEKMNERIIQKALALNLPFEKLLFHCSLNFLASFYS